MQHVLNQFKKELKHAPIDYLLLVTSGIFFLIFLKMFRGERHESLLVLFTFTCFYIGWGVLHHMREKSLQAKNMIEYIVIAFSVFLLLLIFSMY